MLPVSLGNLQVRSETEMTQAKLTDPPSDACGMLPNALTLPGSQTHRTLKMVCCATATFCTYSHAVLTHDGSRKFRYKRTASEWAAYVAPRNIDIHTTVVRLPVVRGQQEKRSLSSMRTRLSVIHGTLADIWPAIVGTLLGIVTSAWRSVGVIRTSLW